MPDPTQGNPVCKHCGASGGHVQWRPLTPSKVCELKDDVAHLREYVGGSDLMSDYQSCDHMRETIKYLQSVIAAVAEAIGSGGQQQQSNRS